MKYVCELCNKTFNRKPSGVKNKKNIFCSHECHRIYVKKYYKDSEERKIRDEKRRNKLRKRIIEYFENIDYEILSNLNNINCVNDYIEIKHNICDTVFNVKVDRFINKGTKCPKKECKLERFKKTHLEKYGYECIFKSMERKEEIQRKRKENFYDNVLLKLENYIPMFSKKEYEGVEDEKKYKFKCLKCGNVIRMYIICGRKPICRECNPRLKGTSESEIEIYEFIKENLKDKYEVFHNFQLPQSRYRIDICIPEIKFALEYNGTYWHCDPRLYEANFYNKSKKMIAQEIWEYDKNRLKKVKEKFSNTMIVWEEDYENDKEKVKKIIIQEINNAEKVKDIHNFGSPSEPFRGCSPDAVDDRGMS